MQLKRDAIHRQIGIAQFEEALLENYAENLFSQELLRCVVAQICGQHISCFDLHKLISPRLSRELEQVERAFDSVDGEEA